MAVTPKVTRRKGLADCVSVGVEFRAKHIEGCRRPALCSGIALVAEPIIETVSSTSLDRAIYWNRQPSPLAQSAVCRTEALLGANRVRDRVGQDYRTASGIPKPTAKWVEAWAESNDQADQRGEDQSVPAGAAKRGSEEGSTLGKRLGEVPMYLGFSQAEVATHFGIPRTALPEAESGQRSVDSLERVRLGRLYELDVGYFTQPAPAGTASAPDFVNLSRRVASTSDGARAKLSRFARYLKARSRRGEK